MGITIKYYNELVPIMNKLITEGYDVDNFCDNDMGYGFYVELDKKYYVEVNIFYTGEVEFWCRLNKRGGKCYHDVVNDINIKKESVSQSDKVEETVRNLINEWAQLKSGDPKGNLLDCLVNFVGLTDQDRKDLDFQLTSLKSLIHEIRSSDSDVTGEASSKIIQDLVDYLIS